MWAIHPAGESMEDQPGSPELFMFLASTVHDMKNSISVLGGTLENLLVQAQGTAQDSPAYPQMAHMLYQTKRLNDNLIQLLALYKEVGKPSYPFEPIAVPVHELVGQLAGGQRILLQSKGIELESSYPADLIWTCDEDLVLGVLAHAINNAVRYTKDKIRLLIAEHDGMLELRVEDNGIGFPPSMLEAGALVGQGINFMTNSSGLGLYFASEVARSHKHRGRHGSISLENGGTLGGGCFILRLP
jgi:two-component system sensor histidine kinase SenX3